MNCTQSERNTALSSKDHHLYGLWTFEHKVNTALSFKDHHFVDFSFTAPGENTSYERFSVSHQEELFNPFKVWSQEAKGSMFYQLSPLWEDLQRNTLSALAVKRHGSEWWKLSEWTGRVVPWSSVWTSLAWRQNTDSSLWDSCITQLRSSATLVKPPQSNS